MIAVSLNVGGGVRLIQPSKLYICTQKHYKHNEDRCTAPDVCGNGSVPLSHSENVVTRIGIHTHTHTHKDKDTKSSLFLTYHWLTICSHSGLPAAPYKMDLDFWDCFGRKKSLSDNQRNTVYIFECAMKRTTKQFYPIV